MPTASIFELAERYSDAWHSHDADQIVALHTPDTVFQMHVGDEPARGRDAVRETFAQILQQWPDLHFEAVTLRFGEDFWVVEWRMTGTNSESGAKMDVDALDVITVKEGRVHTKDTYIDAITVQQQIAQAQEVAA